MTLRRRLARFIDPTIDTYYPEPPLRLGYGMHGVERHLGRIATSLDRLDRKTQKRRPRVIVCEHQNTHPEWADS